jgi:DNA (cytosine-5)-methyltransferase 1
MARGALDARIDPDGHRIIHGWATDIDRNACDTYAANICGGDGSSVFCSDVKLLDMDTLPQVDALAFGFPCNDYSLVGEKRGLDGEYGPLYTFGVKALKLFRPLWFVAENVTGICRSGDGRTFARILGEMKGAGYRLVPHQYRFEDYGVPQARHRVIVVGFRDGLTPVFRPPSPSLRTRKDNSCRAAIESPPIPPGCPNHTFTRQDPRVVERLSYIKPGENAFTADLPEELKLRVKGAFISQIYRRLDPDRPAYTVTGSGGGGTHMYHWSEPRALTSRERARLQTFPDSFVFKGASESVRKQIGMAVPCEGARIIFEAVLRTLAGADYDSVEPNIDPDSGALLKTSPLKPSRELSKEPVRRGPRGPRVNRDWPPLF